MVFQCSGDNGDSDGCVQMEFVVIVVELVSELVVVVVVLLVVVQQWWSSGGRGYGGGCGGGGGGSDGMIFSSTQFIIALVSITAVSINAMLPLCSVYSYSLPVSLTTNLQHTYTTMYTRQGCSLRVVGRLKGCSRQFPWVDTICLKQCFFKLTVKIQFIYTYIYPHLYYINYFSLFLSNISIYLYLANICVFADNFLV